MFDARFVNRASHVRIMPGALQVGLFRVILTCFWGVDGFIVTP